MFPQIPLSFIRDPRLPLPTPATGLIWRSATQTQWRTTTQTQWRSTN